MTLIVFSCKELRTRPLYRCTPEANGTPERPQKTPRNISDKDRELEKLLRSATRLRNAQIRAARTKDQGSKGNSKAQ
jgi:hypothetical protein